MTQYTKVSGIWRTIQDEWTRVGGVWRPSLNSYINVGGVWRKYTAAPATYVFSTVGYTNFILPTSVSAAYNALEVKLWGAGGGGGVWDTNQGGGGGSGGYVRGTISFTPGERFNIFVPSGGTSSVTARISGAGGSWAGIFRQNVPLLIAGGGGGGGAGRSSIGGNGGAGGGLVAGASPNTGFGPGGGQGGTQTAGGVGGNGDAGVGGSGGQYYGGDPQSTSSTGGGRNGADAILGTNAGFAGDRPFQMSDRAGGGGGGAGWYGGGAGGNGGNGGNDGGGGGGGGSSYVAGGSNITNSIGTLGVRNADVLPPNTTDPDYIAGVGVGRASTNATLAGGPGLVVLKFIRI